jgi:hypothetical protein
MSSSQNESAPASVGRGGGFDQQIFNARQSSTSRAAAPHREEMRAAKQLLLAKGESYHGVPNEQIIMRRPRRPFAM